MESRIGQVEREHSVCGGQGWDELGMGESVRLAQQIWRRGGKGERREKDGPTGSYRARWRWD